MKAVSHSVGGPRTVRTYSDLNLNLDLGLQRTRAMEAGEMVDPPPPGEEPEVEYLGEVRCGGGSSYWYR